MDLFCFVDSYF